MVAFPPEGPGTNDAPSNVRQLRSPEAMRIGVLWLAEAEAAHLKLPCIVLDISVAGARLRSKEALLGSLNRLRLSIDFLDTYECAHVWERDGQVGLRFIGNRPTMGRLQDLLSRPPYHSS
jgi:hypothetical protein